MKNNVKIGLFGYGCVGQGLHDVLKSSKGFNSDIETIVVKDKTKKGRLPASSFSYDQEAIINNESIDLVVELIDDADQAYAIVKDALKNGKNVVSANKKLIAEHFQDLIDLQTETGKSLLYEASVCGGIPIIRTLEEYYDNELLQSVSGIFNGSSNYILSKVCNEGLSYDSALVLAQELGFAESDPILDVGGYDSKYKLVIITGHAYGLYINPDELFNYGIQNLDSADVKYAASQNKRIKLISEVVKLDDNTIGAFVIPKLIDEEHALYNVNNEYNGVVVEAAYSDKQVFIGKGAGGHPTGSAVLSDISANRHSYAYEYKKSQQNKNIRFSNNLALEVYFRFGERSDLLNQLRFIEISERNENFVIGKISLNDLIKNKENLELAGAFIASVGEISSLPTQLKKTNEV